MLSERLGHGSLALLFLGCDALDFRVVLSLACSLFRALLAFPLRWSPFCIIGFAPRSPTPLFCTTLTRRSYSLCSSPSRRCFQRHSLFPTLLRTIVKFRL